MDGESANATTAGLTDSPPAVLRHPLGEAVGQGNVEG